MSKKLGLVLSSGAARGWAHIGALRALEEIGVQPNIIAGCSIGALVGGAHLVGALPDFEAWARELKPLSALGAFSLNIGSGGLINAEAAFKAFAHYDMAIEELPVRFAAVATDLGTGEEVWLTEGSLMDAVRASSAIPVVLNAIQRGSRWLIDGAVSNPTPVSLARNMGADIVIAVDLNAVPNVLSRFNPPMAKLPVVRQTPEAPPAETVTGAVSQLIEETRRRIADQIALNKARAKAVPGVFETAYTAAEIYQMHLARARTAADPPDLLLKPDMRDATPMAFDRADDFIAEGRAMVLNHRRDIERLLSE